MQREELLTTHEAISMICRSSSWFSSHCKDADFPQRFCWNDGRTKYVKRSEWLMYCKRHDIQMNL